MNFSASQIALIVNGRIEGNANVEVSSFGKIEEATAGQLTFLANPKYEEYLYGTQASLVIVNDTLSLRQPVKTTLIRVPDAYSAFAAILLKYQEMVTQQIKGIQQPCYISKTAAYGENIFIGAFAYLGENVKVGNNTKIFPNSFVGDNVQIGNGS